MSVKWGASSFLPFLALFSSLVAVDHSAAPPAVDLIGADDTQAAAALQAIEASPVATSASATRSASLRAPTGVWKIRGDLWSAVLDNSNETVWVWDGTQAVAVPTEAEPSDDVQSILPTATAELLQEWRFQFEVAQRAEHPELTDDLRRWRTEAGSSWSLPPQVRYQWFEALKLHVRDRLLVWFDANEIAVPADFVETQAAGKGRTPRGGDPGTEQLRTLVIQCIEGMTREELDELRLPPVALLRTRRR